MKLLDIQGAIGTAILLLSLPCDALHQHTSRNLELLGKRHGHWRLHERATSRTEEGNDTVEGDELKKRGSCSFPSNAGLVAVTPGSSNAGWAMSPDQSCLAGSYCPYACPPGKVMQQWSPDATSYTYPESMAGGLYCDNNGAVSKPFPSKEYCVDGTNTVGAQNECSGTVAFCQTVLPGNEAMLIPTSVSAGGWAQLAVPDTSYWCSTAAHYYVNPPGFTTDEACIWGDGTSDIGNWSPYVAGANTDSSGNTFVKIAWNPIWTASGLATVQPTFGVKVVCSGSGCNGLPCSIDPSVDGIGGVTSSDSAAGAGGANFCVVTVPSGETANIVVFDAGGGSGSSSIAKSSSTTAAATSTSTSQTPTTSTQAATTSSTSSTSSAAPSTTTSSSSSSSSSSTSKPQTTIATSTTSSKISSSTSESFLWKPTSTSNSPHVLFENQTSTADYGSSTGTAVTSLGASGTSPTAAATTTKSSASENFHSSSIFSLIVVLAVAGYLL